MRLRDQIALTLPSLFLRIILGITFLWAGTGKLVGTYEVSGDDAARLANVGIIPIAISPIVPEGVPTETLPDPESTTPNQSAEPSEHESDQSMIPDGTDQIDEAFENVEEALEGLQQRLEDAPTTIEPPVNNPSFDLHPMQYSAKVYSAADFPETMQVQRLYSISLMISKASNPGLTQDSLPIDPIVPAMMGTGVWPKVLAWAAAITELVAGIFLILGLFTRISALSILSVMLVAMWMTHFGPAVVQSNDAILGFIPNKAEVWAPMSYMALFWQLSIAAMAGAVFFLGSGAIGIDRLLFKPKYRDPYVHGDPKAAKSAQTQTPADRGEFDRTPNPTP